MEIAKKSKQYNQNYPLRFKNLAQVYYNSVKEKAHSDIFPCQEPRALGVQTSDKGVFAHTCDPVSYVPCSMKHKGNNTGDSTHAAVLLFQHLYSLSLSPHAT